MNFLERVGLIHFGSPETGQISPKTLYYTLKIPAFDAWNSLTHISILLPDENAREA